LFLNPLKAACAAAEVFLGGEMVIHFGTISTRPAAHIMVFIYGAQGRAHAQAAWDRDEEVTGQRNSAAATKDPDVPWFKRGCGKYGKYLPFQRGNVDQVPLPFINDMDYSLEMKGATRVAINQLGASLSKRQMTAQVCLRAEPPPPPPQSESEAVKKKYKDNVMKQPPPCLIMRGLGLRISQEEKDAYPPELVVLWQPKAWVDRPIAVQWVEQCWAKMIQADKAAGVADEASRYLMIQDNLDAQDASRNPPYITALEQSQTDDHKVQASHFTLPCLPA
jgi:hypothetical protein